MSTSYDPAGSQQYVDYDEYIDLQLQRTREQIRWTDILTALAGIAVAVLAYTFVFVVFDHWVVEGGFSVPARVTMLVIMLTATIAWLAWKVLVPATRKVNSLYAARTIEQSAPQLKNSLLNLIDLKRSGRPLPVEVGSSLERRAAVGISQLDMEQTVDRRLLMRLSLILLGLVVVFCLYTLFSPRKISDSLVRALLPTAAVDVPTRTRITDVTPGDETPVVLRGTRLDVTARLLGEVPDRVLLTFSTSDRLVVDQPVEMRLVDEQIREYRGTIHGAHGDGILQPLTYEITAGDDRAGPFEVQVTDPPTVSIDQLQLTWPAYMELEPRQQTEGHIDSWEATEIELTATADWNSTGRGERSPVAELIITRDQHSGEPAVLPVPLTIDGDRLTGRWELEIPHDPAHPLEADRTVWQGWYRIRLRNQDGLENVNPTWYRLTVRPDRAPLVQLAWPTADLERPLNASVPLKVFARDPDFRLRNVRLMLQKTGAEDTRSEVVFDALESGSRRRSLSLTHELKLDQRRLQLEPGDELQYWLEARDNCETRRRPDGNVAKSHPRLRIRIADRVDDMAAEEQQQQDQQEAEEAASQRNPAEAGEQPKFAPGDDQPQEARPPEAQPEDRKPEGDPQADDGTGEGAARQKPPREGDQQPAEGEQTGSRQGQPQNSEKPAEGEQPRPGDQPQPGDMPEEGKSGEGDAGSSDSADGQSGEKSGGSNKQQGKKTGSEGEPGGEQKSGEGKSGDDPSEDGESGARKPGDQPNQGRRGEGTQKQSDQPKDGSDDGLDPNDETGEALEKLIRRFKEQQKQQQDSGEEGSQPEENAAKPEAGENGKGDEGEKSGSSKQAGGEKPSPEDSPDGNSAEPKTDKPGGGQKPQDRQPAGGEQPADSEQNPAGGKPGEDRPDDSQQGSKGEDSKSGKPEGGSQGKPGETGTGKMKSEDSDGAGGESGAADGKPQPESGGEGKTEPKPGEGAASPKPGKGDPGNPKETEDGGTGTEEPAKGEGTAEKRKARGDETGEGTPETDPAADATKSTKPGELTRKEGTDPARRPGEGDPMKAGEQPKNDGETSGEKRPGSGNPEQAERKPGEKSDRNPDGKSGTDENTGGEKAATKRPDSPPAEGTEPKRGEGRPEAQKSDQPQGGENGGSKQDDAGDRGGDQPGRGETSPREGAGTKSDKPTGGSPDATKPGNAGEGENPNSPQQPGGNQTGKAGSGSPESTPTANPNASGGKPGSEGKPGSKGASGKPGQGDPGAKGQPGDSAGEGAGRGEQADGSTGPGGARGGANSREGSSSNGGAGSGAGGGEEADLEYNRKAANLVLKQLEQQLERGEVDQEMLRELGWNDQQLGRFTEQLKKRLNAPANAAGQSDRLEHRKFDEMLKTLDLRSAPTSRKGSDVRRRVARESAGPGRKRVPPEYRRAFEAYTRSLTEEAARSPKP
ncbi:MAG: hypothetical protein KDA79_06880 [Planctomycetaceae bacterium]|nr:hypothetical protein [Planctomycetaceae bacterium]